MKKTILTAFTAASLLLCSTSAFAELFSVSAGVPFSHSFADTKVESDGVGGFFLAAKLPIMVGVGIESYKTKIKGTTQKLATSMYDIFYQLPVPIVNLIIGLGTGTQEYDCTICSQFYDKGSASQWYTSIGMPIIPFFDIHLSYRSITSKNINYKPNGNKLDFSGSVTGVGIAFNF